MQHFVYRAYDNSGVEVKGRVSAVSAVAATQQLESKGLLVTQVDAEKVSALTTLFGQKKLTIEDLEFLTAEISLLLSNGVKIDKGLDILSRGKSGTRLGDLLKDLSIAVKRGEPLSDAMAEHNVFDNLYINLIRIGEASGELANVFAGLAEDLKFRKALRAKIIQASTYPAVIFFVCLIVVGFVFNYIVPQMSGLFDNNQNLPLYTEVMLGLSDWVREYQWFALFAVGVAAVAARIAHNKGVLKGKLDRWMLKLPVVAGAVKRIEGIRFNSSMALMLEAGVKVDNAIGLAAQNITNGILRDALTAAKDNVKRGTTVSGALQHSPIYSQLTISLIEVGEESGSLTPVFREIASRERDAFESWTSRITSLLEPLMILVMGAIVGTVVVVMLMSIMSVNETL